VRACEKHTFDIKSLSTTNFDRNLYIFLS